MEDEMFGRQHRLGRHEFEQAPGDSGGQGSLAYCSSWDCSVLDKNQQLSQQQQFNQCNTIQKSLKNGQLFMTTWTNLEKHTKKQTTKATYK